MHNAVSRMPRNLPNVQINPFAGDRLCVDGGGRGPFAARTQVGNNYDSPLETQVTAAQDLPW